jgi:hypothetical protein
MTEINIAAATAEYIDVCRKKLFTNAARPFLTNVCILISGIKIMIITRNKAALIVP